MKSKTKECKSKKAVSQMVALILLLALSIVVCAGVIVWQTGYAKELGLYVTKSTSTIMSCQDVDFNVFPSEGCTKLTITNDGNSNINGFVVRSFSSFGTGTETKEILLETPESSNLEINLVDTETVEIMPILKIENELITCTGITEKVTCKGLDDIQTEACNTADSEGTCNLLEDSGIVTCQECCDNLEKCCEC